MSVPGYPAGEAVIVSTLPVCDVHRFASPSSPDEPARFDAKTSMGPWANLCQKHYEQFGLGLGLGLGQRLILPSEVSESEKAGR